MGGGRVPQRNSNQSAKSWGASSHGLAAALYLPFGAEAPYTLFDTTFPFAETLMARLLDQVHRSIYRHARYASSAALPRW